MTRERFTELPPVVSSELTDIICAVQGYVSPSQLGLSTQQTLQQIYDLFQSNVILFNAGNPNGSIAGKTYQLCWDSANKMLWVCTTTGSDTTAVWTKSIQLTAGTGISISQSGDNIVIDATGGTGIDWVEVTGTTQLMAVGHGYKANNASVVTLTLPVSSGFGDQINIMGFGAGGWHVAQGTGQKITIGSTTSTAGSSGYIESVNQFDSVVLICMEDNLTWQCLGAPQGNLTVI